ncbi:MAG: hypothetical protein AAF564_23580 [Bacteroidota bacterium]
MQDLINPETKFQFGKIKMINANLAEIFINEDVKVDLQMAIECEDVMDMLMPGKYGLLLNERSAYSYTDEAESYFSEMDNLHAMAVVLTTRFTDIASKYLQSFHEEVDWNMKVFYDREKALEWLEGKLI